MGMMMRKEQVPPWRKIEFSFELAGEVRGEDRGDNMGAALISVKLFLFWQMMLKILR